MSCLTTSNISKMNFSLVICQILRKKSSRPWSLLRRVLPYVNMSLKGWIWYQGENDMHGFLDQNACGAKVMMRRKPVCPLFWVLAHPKQVLFQSKQGSFGLRIHIYIYTYGYGSSKTFKNYFLCLTIQNGPVNAPYDQFCGVFRTLILTHGQRGSQI